MPILSRSLLVNILTIRRPIIPQLITMTLPVVKIGIKIAIINTKIIIIGVIVIAINIEAIAVVIIEIIKIKEVITPLKDEKKRINIKIKDLKRTLI